MFIGLHVQSWLLHCQKVLSLFGCMIRTFFIFDEECDIGIMRGGEANINIYLRPIRVITHLL